MTREAFDLEKRPYLDHPDTVIHHLKTNLRQAGLERNVEIIVGDFHDSPIHRYGFVFADITHSEVEIELHAEQLRKRLAPGGILACHDTTMENAACLRRLFRFRAEIQIDSLFAGELA